jgi:hypothetical protein
VRSFLRVMASAALLAACAHQQQQYLRTDGAPPNRAQEPSRSAKGKELLRSLLAKPDSHNNWSETEKKRPVSMLAWLATGTFFRSSKRV